MADKILICFGTDPHLVVWRQAQIGSKAFPEFPAGVNIRLEPVFRKHPHPL